MEDQLSEYAFSHPKHLVVATSLLRWPARVQRAERNYHTHKQVPGLRRCFAARMAQQRHPYQKTLPRCARDGRTPPALSIPGHEPKQVRQAVQVNDDFTVLKLSFRLEHAD